jgi:hypothetical protein
MMSHLWAVVEGVQLRRTVLCQQDEDCVKR